MDKFAQRAAWLFVALMLALAACSPASPAAGNPPGATAAAGGTGATGKWCSNVKIVFLPGGTQAGAGMLDLYNGAIQAAADLGAQVRFVWSDSDPQKMTQQFSEAVGTQPDGIAVAGLPGDDVFDPLISDAEAKGILVTSLNVDLPNMDTRFASGGFGYVGAIYYQSGFALGAEAVKRFSLQTGDRALVWGQLSVPDRGLRSQGVIDALKQAGLEVDSLEIDPAILADPSQGTAPFTAYVASHPDVKLVVTDDGGLTAAAAIYLKAAGKNPGEIKFAGFDLSAASEEAIRQGWLNLVSDQQEWLQGYLPVLQLCLSKVYGFSGLKIDTGAGFVDAGNIDIVAALTARNIR